MSFILLINTIYFICVPGWWLPVPFIPGEGVRAGAVGVSPPPGCPPRLWGMCRLEGSGRTGGRNVLAGSLFTPAEQLQP